MPGDPPAEGCWDWTSVINDDGYGILTFKGKNIIASRVSYSIFHGEIPDGQFVLHYCDRPICMQPTHLHLGSKALNNAEMVERNRHAPGERHPNAKITEADVHLIRNSSMTLAELSAVTGISFQTVSKIRRRERWKHVTTPSRHP